MHQLIARAGSVVVLGLAARALAAQPLAPSLAPAARVPTADTVARPSCTYAACALRVEPSFRGPRLVRGATGEVVLGVDVPRRAELARIFAGNDSAASYAEGYVRAQRTNALLTYGGAILMGVGLAQRAPLNAVTGVGMGMLVISFPFQATAQRSLSRAVWWYNGALPPSPPDTR